MPLKAPESWKTGVSPSSHSEQGKSTYKRSKAQSKGAVVVGEMHFGTVKVNMKVWGQ